MSSRACRGSPKERRGTRVREIREIVTNARPLGLSREHYPRAHDQDSREDRPEAKSPMIVSLPLGVSYPLCGYGQN